MTKNRFELINRFKEKYFIDDLPVYIESGGITKDNQGDHILIQLKFKNCGLKAIKAVYISLECYGTMNESYEGVKDFQYLDLHCKAGEYFGADIPVYVPDNRTRSVIIHIHTILFSDGTLLQNENKMENFPKRSILNLTPELRDYYLSLTTPANTLVPIQYPGSWFCSCGALNDKEIETCLSCGKSKELVFRCNDTLLLNNKYQSYLSDLDVELKMQEEKKQQENILQEQKKQKNMKLIKRFVPICVALIILIFGTKFAVSYYQKYQENNKQYQKALTYLDNRQWQKARVVFKRLEGFKDANEQFAQIPEKQKEYELYVIDAKKRAKEAVEIYDFDTAISLYEEIGDKKMTAEVKSQKEDYQYMENVINMYHEGKYQEAFDALDPQNPYYRIFSERDDLYFKYAQQVFDKKYYRKTAEVLDKISNGYIEKNSDNFYMLLALSNYEIERYEEAEKSFAKVSPAVISSEQQVKIDDCILKAGEQSKERKYGELQSLLDKFSFDEATAILQEITPYKNSDQLLAIINERRDGMYNMEEWDDRLAVQSSINVDTLEVRYLFDFVPNRDLEESIKYHKQEMAAGGQRWTEQRREGNIIIVDSPSFTFEFKNSTTLIVHHAAWKGGSLGEPAKDTVYKKEAPL